MDAQGHLYFANYMVYADEVLGAYMEQLGLGAMNPHTAPCLIFTVDIRCEYLSEIAGNSEVNGTVCAEDTVSVASTGPSGIDITSGAGRVCVSTR